MNSGENMIREYPMLNIINRVLPMPLPTVCGLTPDRAASGYLMSYGQFRQSQLGEKLSINQIKQLQRQVGSLQIQLQRGKQLLKERQSVYHQQLLLLKLENTRVRNIINEQGETIEKVSGELARLEGIYGMKLQEVKAVLREEFETEMKQRAKESLIGLQQVRELYVSKIGTLTESYEKRLRQKEETLAMGRGKQVEMQMMEVREQKLQKQLVQLRKENAQLQQRVFSLKKQLDQTRRHIHSEKQSKDTINSQLMARYQQSKQNVQTLQDKLKSIKMEMLSLQQSNKETVYRLNLQLRTKQQQLETFKWKCHRLQEELDQFKNRKTQAGMSINGPFGGEGHAPGVNNKKVFMHNKYEVQRGEMGQYEGGHLQSQLKGDRSDTQQRISYNQQQLRFQTESKVNYQHAIKKMHEMQVKFEQLSMELNEANGRNYLLSSQMEDKQGRLREQGVHVQQLKKYLMQKDQTIKKLTQAKNSLLQNMSKGEGKSDDLIKTLRMNQQTIQSLRRQLQEKSSTVQNMEQQIEKLTKDLGYYKSQSIKVDFVHEMEQKIKQLSEKNNQYRARIQMMEETYKIKVDERQLQLKILSTQVQAKQIQNNQLLQWVKFKENQLQERNNIIKSHQQQIKLLGEKLLKLQGERNQLKLDLAQKADRINQIKEELQVSKQLIKQKDNEIKTLTEINKSTKDNLTKTHQVSKKDDPFNDPFAEPLIKGDDNDNDNVTIPDKIIIDDPKQQPQCNRELQTRLHQYKQRIRQLQTIVEQLKFQWGAAEQNQNGIFTYIKSSYVDQIKLLKVKNEQMQKSLTYTNQIIEKMAKKQFVDAQQNMGKSKGKK